jgi:hypothetical protein
MVFQSVPFVVASVVFLPAVAHFRAPFHRAYNRAEDLAMFTGPADARDVTMPAHSPDVEISA